MLVPQTILDFVRNTRTAVITTHMNPDGDAIGSALGLWHLLRTLGSTATVMLPNAAPSNLLWMEGAASMVVFDESTKQYLDEADTIFVLDLNAVSRLGDLGAAIVASPATVVNIDHHTHPEDFAIASWIDTDACSTAVMIVDIAEALNVTTPSMAMCLYTGIMTDTGSFRFPRTTSGVHRIVATLIDQGADPVRSFD
ncbi:MAG: DHH family phosphoesterase, partial [Candidatus Kapabacteria bacterium]|nr:DHH family phosphoesterase [Candidatus Kapabacteria bacterium]